MKIKDPARFRRWGACGRFALAAVMTGLLAVPAAAKDPQKWPTGFSLASRSGHDTPSALGTTGSAGASRRAAAAIAFPEIRGAGVLFPSGPALRPVAWGEAIQAGRPPVKTGKVLVQLLAGAGVTASAFALSYLTASDSTIDDDEAMRNRTTTWTIVGGAGLTPWLVHLLGESGPEAGSLKRTYLFGAVGAAVGGLALFLAFETDSEALGVFALAVSAFGPAAGAIIGFNSTRRYDGTEPVQTALLNMGQGKLRLGLPAPMLFVSGPDRRSPGLAVRIFEAEL
jgi:hypothetical protein